MFDCLSLPLFPLSGVRCCPQLFTASSANIYHPPLYIVFFFQSSSSPAFLASLLTQSSHLSLGLPRLLLPCSRNSAALFGSLSSAILSACPAHCNLLLTSLFVKLLCTPVYSLNSTILRLSALVRLAIFRTSCFRILVAFVAVVRSVPRFPFSTGMPVWHKCSWICPSVVLRSAGPPSPPQLLSMRSLRPALFDVPLSLSLSLRLPVSAHCRSYTKLSRWLSFFPSSSMSSSSLWWPICAALPDCLLLLAIEKKKAVVSTFNLCGRLYYMLSLEISRSGVPERPLSEPDSESGDNSWANETPQSTKRRSSRLSTFA